MKLKKRIKDLAFFLAGYSLLGICILLVLVLGFKTNLREIYSIALHGNRYLNVSCLFLLVSFIVFPIATIVHIAFTMKMYYRRRNNYPLFVAFLMELMYVFQTLCWKPYKGIDLRWVIHLPRQSAHDRKINVSRWFPRFIETVLWWSITAAVFYTIMIPGDNGIFLKIAQVSSQQRILIFGASIAIIIGASIIFGQLYNLFDHIRVRILDRNRYSQQSKSNHREVSKPVGCTACGGPYPLCKDGCPLFDD